MSDNTWTRTPEEVVQLLGTCVDTGLDLQQAEHRLAVHGPNVIEESRRRSPWRMLLEQFTDFMNVVLSADLDSAPRPGALGSDRNRAAQARLAEWLTTGAPGIARRFSINPLMLVAPRPRRVAAPRSGDRQMA